MGKTRMTFSVSQEVAMYLRSKPNASAVVSDAIRVYRIREMERELEAAYRSDADEADRLDQDWAPANAAIEE